MNACENQFKVTTCKSEKQDCNLGIYVLVTCQINHAIAVSWVPK